MFKTGGHVWGPLGHLPARPGRESDGEKLGRVTLLRAQQNVSGRTGWLSCKCCREVKASENQDCLWNLVIRWFMVREGARCSKLRRVRRL